MTAGLVPKIGLFIQTANAIFTPKCGVLNSPQSTLGNNYCKKQPWSFQPKQYIHIWKFPWCSCWILILTSAPKITCSCVPYFPPHLPNRWTPLYPWSALFLWFIPHIGGSKIHSTPSKKQICGMVGISDALTLESKFLDNHRTQHLKTSRISFLPICHFSVGKD